MATTSLWRIDGWLGHVVVYIENPDKTENPAFYEKPGMTDEQAQSLADVIEYAVNSDKTEQLPREDTEVLQRFVSGVNCFPGTAREEMMAVKRRYGKENGTVAYHGYQSFAPGEATPEIAHEIGVKLAQRLWGDRYQVLIATHLDHESHLHNHFVVNTVSFVDGIKFHRTKEDYRQMREASDDLCREYGLSVIKNPQRGKSQHYGEWHAEKEGRPTWKSSIKDDIDEAVRQSMTERQFWAYLQSHGYQCKIGKDISVCPSGKERFVRLARNLGEDYTLARIRERIISHSRGGVLPEYERKAQRTEYRRDLNKVKKATGFRALYYHYCYLLGIFPQKKPSYPRTRVHHLLREDLMKMDAISEEAKLLARCQIDTAEQLSSYQSDLESQIETVTATRAALYKSQRTVAVKNDLEKLAAVKAEASALSKELKWLRKEVRLCEDIATRSGAIMEKVIKAEEFEQEKEETRDEQLRRRGGTSR